MNQCGLLARDFPLNHFCRKVCGAPTTCLPGAVTLEVLPKGTVKLSLSLGEVSEGMLVGQCEGKGPRRWLRSPRGQSHAIDLGSASRCLA